MWNDHAVLSDGPVQKGKRLVGAGSAQHAIDDRVQDGFGGLERLPVGRDGEKTPGAEQDEGVQITKRGSPQGPSKGHPSVHGPVAMLAAALFGRPYGG